MAKSPDEALDAWVRHLAEVEMELARYGEKYGFTDNARRLLIDSPLSDLALIKERLKKLI